MNRAITVSLKCFTIAAFAGSSFASVHSDVKKNAGKKPNIVYIITDQQRADSLHCSGNRVIETPNLDRLAREGVRFTNAFTCTGQCMPSRAAILTGRYPHSNRVFCNGDALPEEELTAAEILNAHGYRSVAVGKMHFARPDTTHGFEYFEIGGHIFSYGRYREYLKKQGIKWDREHHPYGPPKNPDFVRHLISGTSHVPEKHFITAYTAAVAMKKLEELRGSRPFALWIGFSGPHPPYFPPEPWASKYKPQEMLLPKWINNEFQNKYPRQERFYSRFEYLRLFGLSDGGKQFYLKGRTPDDFRNMIAKYYGFVSMIDKYVGKILDRIDSLGMRENTIVVFTSDHGDFLGEHRLAFKLTANYDALTHVPLIIRYPRKIAPGRVFKHLVSHVDHLPTILEMAGVPEPKIQQRETIIEWKYRLLQGRSFASLLSGKKYRKSRNFVFFETGCSFYTEKRIKGLRSILFRYNVNWQFKEELYDLKKDPGELYNVAGNPIYADVLRKFRKKMHKWHYENDTRSYPPNSSGQRQIVY